MSTIITKDDLNLNDGLLTIHGFLEVKKNPDKLFILMTGDIEINDNRYNPYGLISWGNNTKRKPYWAKIPMLKTKCFQLLAGQGNLKTMAQFSKENMKLHQYKNTKGELRDFLPIKIINPINNITNEPLNLQITQSIFPNSNMLSYIRMENPDDTEYLIKKEEYIKRSMKKIYMTQTINDIVEKVPVEVYTKHDNKPCAVFEEITIVSGTPYHTLIKYEIASIEQPYYLTTTNENQTNLDSNFDRSHFEEMVNSV